eukprot:TRINITY_DN103368_c0_g1_i1.p1 TRINITY_DN103368_c0_g1~~TRINITY_DN103368_c0_g1_i1.p1  ORF type:complete len:307 (-),score=57.60 TRINITY_DN103368_c0_g1_i1:14-934(-)
MIMLFQLLFAAAGLVASHVTWAPASCGSSECQEPELLASENLQLLQHAVGVRERRNESKRDGLVMAYVPFNFGHTVAEKVAQVGTQWGDCGSRTPVEGCLGWATSEKTGCPLMYTPAKLWPQELAKLHFGGKKVFGILRDPYERLVAQFRGSYRLKHPELGCDVNAAVKQMMRDYLWSVALGDPYSENCNWLPQAEYFDQPFGATLPVDNRYFPESMNEVLAVYGFPQIAHDEVQHVSGCDEKWVGDLDPEAKQLVRSVYERDFELICTHFGHCEKDEETCLTHIEGMCPEHIFRWNSSVSRYERM